MKPQRILLIRHGESQGNIDKNIYSEIPDYALELTEKGKNQAIEAGKKLKELVGDSKTAFYVSPMWRTRMTFEGISKSFDKDKINYKEDPRLREQEWGHLQNAEETKKLYQERDAYGIFYFRFRNGESGADVYDRMSDFMATMHRDFEKNDFPENMVLVTHGLSIRLFLMRWFHLTVEEFEKIKNPDNCQIISMIKNEKGKYELENPLETHEVYNKFHRPVNF